MYYVICISPVGDRNRFLCSVIVGGWVRYFFLSIFFLAAGLQQRRSDGLRRLREDSLQRPGRLFGHR